MDEAIKKFNDETIIILSEMYIDELIFEDAIHYCEDIEKLNIIQEAYDKSIKNKSKEIQKTVGDLAKKFASFIKGLISNITTLFSTGENIVNKYEKRIRETHKKEGKEIKVKTHKYINNTKGLETLVYDILSEMDSTFSKGNANQYINEFKSKAIKCIRKGPKKEYKISELNIDDIISLTGNKKEIIQSLKSINNRVQKDLKNMQTIMLSKRKDGTIDRETTKDSLSTIKTTSRCITLVVSSYITEVKNANRAYTIICKKLITGKAQIMKDKIKDSL